MDTLDYNTVSPGSFVSNMERHWTETLGNATSEPLRSVWHSMANAFGQAILSIGDGRVWRVLNPPTGAGKTQGTVVYASMLAKADQTTGRRTGMLVVTRQIVEADAFAAEVNRLAGVECAVARHSSHMVAPEAMAEALVLVVTHAAYTLALDNVGGDGSRLRDLLTMANGKTRRLVVVDESLANVVEQHRLRAEDVRQALSFVDIGIRSQFPDQTAALDETLRVLEAISKVTSGSTDKDDTQARIVWRAVHDGRVAFPERYSMTGLRGCMSGLRYDHIALRKDSPLDRQRIAGIVDETLSAVETILSRWAWYSKVGVEHSLNTARLIIPDDLPGPVVLDATARQQVLWELLGDRAVIQPIPSGARSYSNVTLHVSRTSKGIGKGKMTETAAKRFPRVMQALADALPDHADRSVFLCCHKRIEHVPLSFEHPFARLSVAHWGAVDGRNDWQDHDVAVLVGLPYFDGLWAANVFFATQGLQTDEWLRNPKWKSYPDVRREMQTKQLTTSIVQAINRIRCRRVIDADGNCPPADVFVILPTGGEGDAIVANLREEMPGLNVQPWAFDLDGEEVRLRRGSSHAALVAFMQNRLPGETSMSAVQKELGLSVQARKDLAKCLRDAQHPLSKSLAAIDVTYVSSGAGRAARSYLMKAIPKPKAGEDPSAELLAPRAPVASFKSERGYVTTANHLSRNSGQHRSTF